MIKKKYCILFCAVLYCAAVLFGEELIYARPKTAALDIELSQVKLQAVLFDGDRIGYRYDLKDGKKLACIETLHTLRIRELIPAEGTLYVFIPKTMLLESCNFRGSKTDFTVENLQTAAFSAMVNNGTLSLKNCRFKTAVMTLTRGNLRLDKTEIMRGGAITVSNAVAEILLPGESSRYHIDYTHNGGALHIDSQPYVKTSGEYGNPKAKQRLILSGGASTVSVRFAEKNQNP